MEKTGYEIVKELDKNKHYKLACGHNNVGLMPVWPFEFVCLECGFKTMRVEIQKGEGAVGIWKQSIYLKSPNQSTT